MSWPTSLESHVYYSSERWSATSAAELRQAILDLHRRTSPQQDTIGTTGLTGSLVYGDLTDRVGPSVSAVIGQTGKALTTLYSSLQNDTADSLVAVTYQVSGANTYGPFDSDAVSTTIGLAMTSSRIGATHVSFFPNPGLCTWTLRYKVSAGIGYFVDRRTTVTPLGE